MGLTNYRTPAGVLSQGSWTLGSACGATRARLSMRFRGSSYLEPNPLKCHSRGGYFSEEFRARTRRDTAWAEAHPTNDRRRLLLAYSFAVFPEGQSLHASDAVRDLGRQ